MVRWSIAALATLSGLALTACVRMPVRPDHEVVQTLAPTGALRVALYTGTPTSLLSTSDLRGIGYELGKELAGRLGVAFEPMVFSKNADVLDAVTTGHADVAFTNASAERAKQMSFTEPYLVIELGYLARAGAPVRSLRDVDQAGVRVGVTAKSSSDAILSHDLKSAQVVRAESVSSGVRLMATGAIDLYATNKATLFEMAGQLSGARVLEGNWGHEQHALGIPLGRERGLPYLRAFIADATASGLVRGAVARAGLQGSALAGFAH